VHGLNPAHGLDFSGVVACGAGRTCLLTRLGPPGEADPHGGRPHARRVQRRGHRAVATRAAALWRGRRRRSGGPSMTWSWTIAPWLSGRCAGQGEWRWGSPRAAVDCEVGWRLGAAVHDGVLTGGRVGSDAS
jgi:hypothetical protein